MWLLARELRRLAWADEHSATVNLASGATMHRRTALLIRHLELCIEQVRELPSYDGTAAARYAAEAEELGRRMRPRYP
jgi:hypothetical protein